MTFDYLIVGQGIAGTVLAFKLMQENKSVCVIDNHHHLSSSKIAAGIVNPITGRKYVKSWMIDDLIPESRETYFALEKLLDIKVIHDANIIRTIPNREAQLNWERIELDDSATKYIVDKPSLGNYNSILKPLFDFGELTKSFRVDMKNLLASFRDYLEKDKRLILEKFDYNKLIFDESLIEYKGIKANNIIFSEGFHATQNPFFNYLPFQPAKGEAIIFTLDNFHADKILRHKQFMVPFGNGEFWSGGGYEWKQLDDTTTIKFKDNWLTQMSDMINSKPTIIEHKAAVRPAVKGRRPLIGNHPRIKNVYIFNGMGTKGASLVPYWAKHLVSHLLRGENISDEVSISRFLSYYE